MVLFFGGCFAPERKREKLRLQAGTEKEGRQREDSLFIRSLSSAGSYLREAPARDGSAILLATTAPAPCVMSAIGWPLTLGGSISDRAKAKFQLSERSVAFAYQLEEKFVFVMNERKMQR